MRVQGGGEGVLYHIRENTQGEDESQEIIKWCRNLKAYLITGFYMLIKNNIYMLIEKR